MSRAHALLRQWPADARDSLPLALWDAAAIEAATGGKASHQFQASGIDLPQLTVLMMMIKRRMLDLLPKLPAVLPPNCNWQ